MTVVGLIILFIILVSFGIRIVEGVKILENEKDQEIRKQTLFSVVGQLICVVGCLVLFVIALIL